MREFGSKAEGVSADMINAVEDAVVMFQKSVTKDSSTSVSLCGGLREGNGGWEALLQVHLKAPQRLVLDKVPVSAINLFACDFEGKVKVNQTSPKKSTCRNKIGVVTTSFKKHLKVGKDDLFSQNIDKKHGISSVEMYHLAFPEGSAKDALCVFAYYGRGAADGKSFTSFMDIDIEERTDGLSVKQQQRMKQNIVFVEVQQAYEQSGLRENRGSTSANLGNVIASITKDMMCCAHDPVVDSIAVVRLLIELKPEQLLQYITSHAKSWIEICCQVEKDAIWKQRVAALKEA
jgi:hypothetical protein